MVQQETALTCCYVRGRINVCLRFGEPSRRQSGNGLTTYWFAPGRRFGITWWARVSPRRQVAGFAVAEALDAGHGGFRLPCVDRAVAVHAFLHCRCVGKDRGVVGRAVELIQNIHDAGVDPCIVPPVYYRFAGQALRVGRAPRTINPNELFAFLQEQNHAS
jgi:hypothetical protein